MPCRHPAAPGAGESELVVLVLGSPHRLALLRDRSNTQLGGGTPITLGKFSFWYFIISLVYLIFEFVLFIKNIQN